MMYPFVTFWRLEQWRYLLLALVVLVGLLGIVAAVTAAVQLFLQNSYFSFAVLSLLFMGAYLLAYVQMGNVWDLIRELFNPTVLYVTSGGWFMEMICACRLQEMNLPCYSAVERLRSA